MDNNKIYELLYQKTEILQKRLNRLFLFLFLFPLIYFLLDNSFISTIKTPLISIEQAEIILLTFPLVYAAVLSLIVIISGRIGDIQKQMNKLENQNSMITKEIKDLLTPVVFLNEIMSKVDSKGFLGCLGSLIVHVPIILFCFFFPFVFLGFLIYQNFNYDGDYESISFWVSVFAIWTFVATIVQIVFAIKKSNKQKNTTANNV